MKIPVNPDKLPRDTIGGPEIQSKRSQREQSSDKSRQQWTRRILTQALIQILRESARFRVSSLALLRSTFATTHPSLEHRFWTEYRLG